MCFISLLPFMEEKDSIGKMYPIELSSYRKEGRLKVNAGKQSLAETTGENMEQIK